MNYTCFRTPSPIVIDGRLDEHVWAQAPASPAFVDIVTGAAAWFDTRVRLLWDDTCLYFGFAAEETDVWGTLTERDSTIYEENDLEIFIAGKNAYYEFEISACNVIYEVFWIWKDAHKPGGAYWGRPEFDPATQRTMVLDGVGGHVHERGERWGFLDWDMAGLQHAVHVDGTLNQRDDVDRGGPPRSPFRGRVCPCWLTGVRFPRAMVRCGGSTARVFRRSGATAKCWIHALAGPGMCTGTTTRTSPKCSRRFDSPRTSWDEMNRLCQAALQHAEKRGGRAYGADRAGRAGTVSVYRGMTLLLPE